MMEVDQDRMPSTASLVLVLYFSLLAGANLVIVIPTADDYAKRLGADELFSGLMIGAVPLCGIIGVAMNQYLLTRLAVSFKSVLLLLSVGAVIGNVLYALAGLTRAKWTLLIARSIIGLSIGFNLPTMYIGITVGMKRRSEIILYFSALNTLGYAIGPALAAAIAVFLEDVVHIENLVLDKDTAPGWLMAFAYLLFIAKIAVMFEDLPVGMTAPKSLATSSPSAERFPIVGGCAGFWYACISSLTMTASEVYGANVAQRYWGWSIAGSGLFLAALMLCSGLSSIAMGRLCARFMRSDRAGIVGGSLLCCISCVPLFNFDLHAITAQASMLGVGLVLVLSIVGVMRGLALAMSSKLVLEQMKSSMNSFIVLGLMVGRGVGAIIGSVLDPISFAPMFLGIFVVTLLVSCASYNHMKPHEKAC
jgi:MFS family permease